VRHVTQAGLSVSGWLQAAASRAAALQALGAVAPVRLGGLPAPKGGSRSALPQEGLTAACA